MSNFNIPQNLFGVNSTVVLGSGISVAETLIEHYNLSKIKIKRQPSNQFQISKSIQQDFPYYYSALGTPVLADLTFGEGRAGTPNSFTNNNGQLISYDTFTLVTVLITLSQAKNIVKTPIQGRDGTVKEYIGMGDYVVKIDGILTAPNGVYPKDGLMALKNMLTCPISIPVTSWYLQMFDIDYIVVEAFDIAQQEGSYSQQPFTISGLSDNEVQLIIQ